MATDNVRKCVEVWFEMSSEWQKLRVTAVKHIQTFTAAKTEAMNSACGSLNIEGVTEAVDVGEILKEMVGLTIFCIIEWISQLVENSQFFLLH